MEKNGKIVLIDKELSEGQQKLSRFIEYYTKVPFTGETYNEWSMWVALNKEYAEHEKAKAAENASRDASVKRQQKPRDKKRGREIAVDAEKLYAVIKEIGETNGHICALCGFGHSYLSHVKQRGWMYESDIEKLAQVNIDPGDYVTDAWYRAKHELDVMDPVPETAAEDSEEEKLEEAREYKDSDLVTGEEIMTALRLTEDQKRVVRTVCMWYGTLPYDYIRCCVEEFVEQDSKGLSKLFGAGGQDDD